MDFCIEIIEGRVRDEPTRWRIQMLHDSANDGGFVALKRAAEDREGWRQERKGVKKPAVQVTTED